MRWAERSVACVAAVLLTTTSFAAEKEADFDLPMPVGIPVNGVRIPHLGEDGSLLMLMEADVAKKIDERTVELEGLSIEATDDEGRQIFVEVPHAFFNLDDRILTGERSATIRREDFEIVGDELEFDTRTRFGTMRGNVKMTIATDNLSQ
jgi:lipopolysaccharide assembly outer membrane protein LptD (OstA)